MVDTVVSLDGVPISYETRGAGMPALVFVHGWSCDRGYWAGQLAPLSREFRVVAVDLAGHGESGFGRKTWTIAAFGGDVAAVADKLGLERTILVGHSMGGDVIVEAARRMHGGVAGLVWVDVYKELRARLTLEQVEMLMAPFRTAFAETTRTFVRGMFPPGSDPTLVERVAADMAAAPPAIALEAMKSARLYGNEVGGHLRELKLPAVAINPDDHPTDIESLKSHGVGVVLMPGVGHFPMMEDPDRFNRLLREAIEQLLRRPGARANSVTRRTRA